MMPAVYVSLGPYSNELLFDLSEGGLSIYGRVPAPDRDGFRITLSLPGNPSPIQARGEIAWNSKSRNRTGIRFTELSLNSRLQLQNWMSTNLPAAAPYKEYYDVEVTGRIDQLIEAIREGAFDSRLVKRSVMIAAILVSAFLSGLVLSDYHWRTSETLEASSEAAAPPRTEVGPASSSQKESLEPSKPASLSKSLSLTSPAQPVHKPPTEAHPQPSTSPSSSAPAPIPAATLSRATPNAAPVQFVVQVGAMREKRNADALSASLQQKGFSVVRSRIAEDGIYRVAVGPYLDLRSANEAKRGLEAQNVPSFVTRWMPQQ